MINRRTALAMIAALPGVACGKVPTKSEGKLILRHARVCASAREGLPPSSVVGVVFPDHPYVFWVKPPPEKMAKNAHVCVMGREDARWDIGFRPERIVMWEVD